MSPVYDFDVQELLSEVTAAGAGDVFECPFPRRSFQLKGHTTAGAGAASVDVQACNDGENWFSIGTITLTLGTTVTSDGFSSDAPWRKLRGKVNSISGTGAQVTLLMSNA